MQSVQLLFTPLRPASCAIPDTKNEMFPKTYRVALLPLYNGRSMGSLPPETDEDQPAGDRLAERIAAFLEILLVALFGSLLTLAAFQAFGIDPIAHARSVFVFLLAESVLTIVVILVLLRLRRQRLSDLGIVAAGWLHEVAIGFLVLPVLFGSTLVVSLFFQRFLPQFVQTENPLLDLVRSPLDLALFMLSSLWVGGIKEEVQRAFILTRFDRHLGGIWLGLFVWSAFFGLMHGMQGIDKAAGAGVLGFLFGLVYIWRGKLIAPMVAHALYDITTLVIFWTAVRDYS